MLQRDMSLVHGEHGGGGSLVSFTQLMAVMLQLQKVTNHPKCILYQYDRDRATAMSLARRAAGRNVCGHS
jgi:hypothetical protein